MYSRLPDIYYDPLLGVTNLFSEHCRFSKPRPYSIGNNEASRSRLQIHSPNPLSAWDQSVYMAAVAAAMASSVTIDAATTTSVGRALWDGLRVSNAALAPHSALASCSKRRIERLAGLRRSGGRTNARLIDALEKLACVECRFVQSPVTWSAQLLSWMQDEAGIHIALHPHISRVARGVSGRSPFKRRYTVLSLEERYSLEDSIARIAHAWLSCWLRRYETGLRTISLEKLADHVWGDTLNPRSEKHRLSRLRSALSDIGELADWMLTFDGDDVLILRGKLALPADSSSVPTRTADSSVAAAELSPAEVDLLLTNQPVADAGAPFQNYQLRAEVPSP
jgi:hypothetical protein